jgi:multidrug efflux pump subunit AcrA (membrane-fusion protein)
LFRRTALALTLAATVVLAGCSGDGAANAPSSSPPASSTTAGETTPTESAFTGTEIVVAVKNGKVVPPTHRVKVAKGTQVRLVVTSDKADQVHVHGYDIEKDLPAGKPTTLEFSADQTGLFEIETHESGLQLVQLEVR